MFEVSQYYVIANHSSSLITLTTSSLIQFQVERKQFTLVLLDAESSMFMESAGAEEGIEAAFSENEVTEKNGENEAELDLSIGDPPDSEELIHAIQELDDAASGDADIR